MWHAHFIGFSHLGNWTHFSNLNWCMCLVLGLWPYCPWMSQWFLVFDLMEVLGHIKQIFFPFSFDFWNDGFLRF